MVCHHIELVKIVLCDGFPLRAEIYYLSLSRYIMCVCDVLRGRLEFSVEKIKRRAQRHFVMSAAQNGFVFRHRICVRVDVSRDFMAAKRFGLKRLCL